MPDNTFADGLIAERSIADLRRLSRMDKPFFLAVGFLKPHLPFVAPKKYWDLYDRQSIQLPDNYYRPQDAPAVSLHTSGELRSYAHVPAKGPVSNEMARDLIHGYYACVSYTDALVGRVLEELRRLDLESNTIIVLWGDHGWNLAEHTLWCKHSCYETSMRAPLIVVAPGIEGGKSTKGLTEFIDIYPTLCELAGIAVPQHVVGQSLVPLLKDPQRRWKEAAIGRYRTGDTIRTDTMRFTEFSNAKEVTARMLYDHQKDADENVNVAEQESYSEQVEALTKKLRSEKGK